jgi:hypothetical protein
MTKPTKIGTVALIIDLRDDETPVILETLSDDAEIATLEAALGAGEQDPLTIVHQMRARQQREDDEFGNYVEELLSQPFVRPEIQEHGIQWLKSKIRIEDFQKKEADATKVIAEYALKVYRDNPAAKDFFLAGPAAKVRIRVFPLKNAVTRTGSDPRAA